MTARERDRKGPGSTKIRSRAVMPCHPPSAVLKEATEVAIGDDRAPAELARDELASANRGIDTVATDPRMRADFRNREGGAAGQLMDCSTHEEASLFRRRQQDEGSRKRP
jgi:hypothetical protein